MRRLAAKISALKKSARRATATCPKDKTYSIDVQAVTLCQKCAEINIEDNTAYSLSQLKRVRSSAQQGCPGCFFFLSIMQRHMQSASGELLVLLRRPDLTETKVLLRILRNEEDIIGHTVFLRLCSSYGKCLLVADTFRRIKKSGFEPLVSTECEDVDAELGRIIVTHAAEPQVLNLAKEWLHRCTSSHGQACALEKDAPSPTRLIHVPMDTNEPLSLRYTRDIRGLPYVALSYCWGRGSTFKTTPSTLKDRLSGFSTSDLPKVLQDAVYITREFGLQWLWIDALCIIQGDAADWSYESALMADTYGNATFVISADLADDVDKGIFLPRNQPVSHRFGIDGLEGLCLQRESVIRGSLLQEPLSWRGWAFQERILAPRILHFLNDQMAWECNTTFYREGMRVRGSYQDKDFGKFKFTPYVHQKRTSGRTPTTGYGDEIDLQLRLKSWNDIVKGLKKRFFTVESDTLPAISGLATAIQVPGLGQYFAGVWEYNPFVSMIWYEISSQKLSSTYRAPSWSWVSANRRIRWFEAVLRTDLTTQLVTEGRAWDVQFGPRLLYQHMELKSADPKGEVLEGSFMDMSGYCRYVYIAPESQEVYNPPFWSREDLRGIVPYMDGRDYDWTLSLIFEGGSCNEFLSVVPTNAQRYLCVQVAQERWANQEPPKTVALILEAVEGTDAFRRVGILKFHLQEQDHTKWTRRDLRLV